MRWFRSLTGKAIRRGVFKSAADVIAAIEAYLNAGNDHPGRSCGPLTAGEILEKMWRAGVPSALRRGFGR